MYKCIFGQTFHVCETAIGFYACSYCQQNLFVDLHLHDFTVIPDAPPIPPSVSKHVEDGLQKMTVWQSILSLLKNISFLFFLIVFGE